MLASCVMLTNNRRHLAPVALACYLAQDWQEKELIVVDDGTDPIEDLGANIPGARYFRTERFKTVGEKLNFACEQARGEAIVTWDDDDWYAPTRLSDQMNRLITSGKSLTGYHTILFFDGERASQYRGSKNYATGTSQVYLKSFWERHRFPAMDCGYDNHIWQPAARASDVVAVDGSQMIVARIHSSNVSGERRNGSIGTDIWGWVPKEMIPAEFFAAVGAA